MPLTTEQILAKRSFVRKGMFLTSDPRQGAWSRELRAPRYGDPLPPSLSEAAEGYREIEERLAAVRQKIEDIKQGTL